MRRYFVRIGITLAVLVVGEILFDGIIPSLSNQRPDWTTRSAAMSVADFAIDHLTITGEPANMASLYGVTGGPLHLKPGVEFIRESDSHGPALIVRNHRVIGEILWFLRTATEPSGVAPALDFPNVQIYCRDSTPEDAPEKISYVGSLFGNRQSIDRALGLPEYP